MRKNHASAGYAKASATIAGTVVAKGIGSHHEIVDGIIDSPMAHVTETPATAFLKKVGVAFTEHPYDYVAHGGTKTSADALGVAEHAVVKTLVMEDENKKPLIVLMHGDREVSTKNLARQIGKKRVEPCKPDVAERHSGYQVGGTSPFGLRKPMPIFVEASVLALDRIFINGGRRGYLVGIDPNELTRVVAAQPVNVALEK
jgi:Cys-tRNA(Pro) deacylase